LPPKVSNAQPRRAQAIAAWRGSPAAVNRRTSADSWSMPAWMSPSSKAAMAVDFAALACASGSVATLRS
jgi:hypothetical protein